MVCKTAKREGDLGYKMKTIIGVFMVLGISVVGLWAFGMWLLPIYFQNFNSYTSLGQMGMILWASSYLVVIGYMVGKDLQ